MAQNEVFTAGTYKEGNQAGWPAGGPNGTFGGSGDIDDWVDTGDGRLFEYSVLAHSDVGCGLKFTNVHTIPDNATINYVKAEAYLRLFNASISCGLFLYNTITGGKDWQNASPGGAWAISSQNWPRDGDNNPWGAADDVFNHVFGVAYWDGTATAYLHFSCIRITINFTLPTPTIETTAASAIGAGQATLNATLNPNSANATYPVSYKFRWGTDSLLATYDETVPIGNQTGIADIAASSTITGLLADTIYYYQAIAYNDDVTVYGEIKRLSSNAEDRFWLDEFHPLDGDLESNKALMRWTTVGFDIGADLLDCPDADREDL